MKSRANIRLTAVVLLSLLPWPAVWLGMYKLNSIFATFFLYHAVCLLPAAIRHRRLWIASLLAPTWRQWLWLLAAMVIGSGIAIAAYKASGTQIISRVDLIQSLSQRGFAPSQMIPVCLYFVVINATLEELFWRGVILNELMHLASTKRFFGEIWASLSFAAWHYLVLRLLLKPGWAELAVAGVLIFGLCMCLLYRKTGSIVLPILWHALVFDLALVVLFAYICQRQ